MPPEILTLNLRSPYCQTDMSPTCCTCMALMNDRCAPQILFGRCKEYTIFLQVFASSSGSRDGSPDDEEDFSQAFLGSSAVSRRDLEMVFNNAAHWHLLLGNQ